jgi:hypothetical protein
LLFAVHFAKMNSEQLIVAQTSLIKAQMALESGVCAIAASGTQPAVVLCDRGTLDSKVSPRLLPETGPRRSILSPPCLASFKAYMAPEAWAQMLDHNEWTIGGLRDRYPRQLSLCAELRVVAAWQTV